jgi:hypothetical protein
MKIRNGFVSNSSTSSFICDVCGEEYTGWDASPFDSNYDCSVCENGHNICNEHLNGDYDKDDECQLLEKFCPICQFKDYSNYEMATYLEKTRKISRDEVFAKIKAVNKRRRKLYDEEYINYVLDKNSLTDDDVINEIKEKFQVYKEYRKFLNSKD